MNIGSGFFKFQKIK